MLRSLSLDQVKGTVHLHLDLYPCEINLNILLFEILFLKLLNYNDHEFFQIPADIKIYIEVANTF